MTALIVRGAGRRGAQFSISLDRVAISREAVERVITGVEDFVRNGSFTQRSLFPDSGVATLQDAVAPADNVIVTEDYNPWSVFGDWCNDHVVSDLQSCQKVVLRRKASRDTSGRWIGAQSDGSPSAATTPARRGVRISNIVGVGLVHYVNSREPTASSSGCEESADREQKAGICVVPAKVPQTF